MTGDAEALHIAAPPVIARLATQMQSIRLQV